MRKGGRMVGDKMGRALPWLLGATIVLLGPIIALVFIGRAYAPDHIHEAAVNGNVLMVKWFLLVRPDLLDAPDAHGDTPLHWATASGHANVMDVLLRGGCGCQREGRRRPDTAALGDGLGPRGTGAWGRRAHRGRAILP